MSGFVYMWVNTINSKKYIGSHVGNEDDGYIGSGSIFKKAIEKYGVENFERVILERVENDNDIFDREDYYLQLFNVANDKQFYNIRDKAGGGFEYINNGPLAEHYKNKRVIKQKKWLADNEHPKGMKGKTHTDEHRAKLKQYAIINNELNKRPVLQYDLHGNLVAEYDSLTAAAKAVRGVPSNIKYMIEGKFTKAYKHKWKYKDA